MNNTSTTAIDAFDALIWGQLNILREQKFEMFGLTLNNIYTILFLSSVQALSITWSTALIEKIHACGYL